MSSSPVALVTGANRGIGYEVCRQLAQQGYVTLLGSRDDAKGAAAAQALQREGLNVVGCELDVTNAATIEGVRAAVERDYGRLDVLVNNAAVNYDTWQRGVSADLDVVAQTMDTNVYAAWRMVQAFLPLLRKSAHGRIVNVSSESGSLAGMGGGTPAYSMSKATLNALTRILASELHGERILVNSVCPGWVATDMGGSGGRPVRDGAASVMWAVTLPDGGPTGGFYRDGKPLRW